MKMAHDGGKLIQLNGISKLLTMSNEHIISLNSLLFIPSGNIMIYHIFFLSFEGNKNC